jgi:hypothetical protein
MPESRTQATRFFATRIAHQASSDGTPLSDVERQMLNWSESDPTSKADPQLPAALASEMSDDEYEAKVCGLLQRAFAADLAADPHAREKWRRAFAALQRGDYYIAIMIERALGSKVRNRRWWPQVWGLRAVPAALVVMLVLLAYLAGVQALLGHTPDREEYGMVTWVLAMALALVYGLARLVFGGDAVDGFVDRAIERVLGNRHP